LSGEGKRWIEEGVTEAGLAGEKTDGGGRGYRDGQGDEEMRFRGTEIG